MLTQTAVRNASWKKTASGTVPPAPQPQTGPLDLMGAQMSFPRNAEIYGEGEAADYIYRVVSGAVRTYKVLADGRRQVGGFYLPGDMFGLEPGDEHTFSAEAIAESKVLVIKRSAAVALAERDSEAARQLWNLTGRELRRVQDHILLFSAPTNASRPFFWKWRSGFPAAMRSICRCRARTLPIISD